MFPKKKKENSVLNQKVLQLNTNWQPIGIITVKTAIEDMNSKYHPKKALKIEYFDENNFLDFSKPSEIIPLSWDQWTKINPRVFDEDIIRSPRLILRVPTVVIVPNYRKMPIKTFRSTKRNIYERYKGRCAYTNKYLSYKVATLDHVQPRSKQGLNSWNNLVLADPEINRKKGNRTPEEAGLILLYKPSEPKPVPASIMIREEHIDWSFFIKHGQYGNYTDK